MFLSDIIVGQSNRKRQADKDANIIALLATRRHVISILALGERIPPSWIMIDSTVICKAANKTTIYVSIYFQSKLI